MNEVDLSCWADAYRENAEKIHRVANQIKNINKLLGLGYTSGVQWETLQHNIHNVLDNWTGCTYIGHRKEKVLKKAYQAFFEALYEWLFCLKKISDEDIQRFVSAALYQGTLYRYLGHGSSQDDTEEKVEPIYDKYYVSWSKKKYNTNFKCKLYGTITHLTCKVDNMYYGIDLSAFGVVKGTEQEVVFPTIKETVMNVEYIERLL